MVYDIYLARCCCASICRFIPIRFSATWHKARLLTARLTSTHTLATSTVITFRQWTSLGFPTNTFSIQNVIRITQTRYTITTNISDQLQKIFRVTSSYERIFKGIKIDFCVKFLVIAVVNIDSLPSIVVVLIVVVRNSDIPFLSSLFFLTTLNVQKISR